MPIAAGIVQAAAAVNNNILGGISTIFNIKQGKKANENAEKQNKIAQEQVGLSRDANKIAQDNLELQKTNTKTGMEATIHGFDKEITGYRNEIDRIKYIELVETQSQIDSYDKWLANYSNQYAQEVQSKQAQIDNLVASGREAYNNFIDAIGYSDAMAGATGRVGAGTSQAHTTGMLDQKLVDFVGADRILDANGGLFGSQLTAANMEMEQLKVELDFQRQEMLGNRAIAVGSQAYWNNAITGYEGSIIKSTDAMNEAKTDLEGFVEKNFGEEKSVGDVIKTIQGNIVNKAKDYLAGE